MDTFIGIDGGATKISAGIVRKFDTDNYGLESEPVFVGVKNCPSYSRDFSPVSIERQLAAHESDSLQISIEEERQGIAYAEASESVLFNLSEGTSIEKLPIGFGMPGMKTKDRRGISVMNNGPRMPRFLNVLNRRLTMAHLPVSNIETIGDDNNYCGLGEFYSIDGALRNVTNGLYIGGGTGIADAIVLDGKPVPFETVENRLEKTWKISTPGGVSIESLISQNGLMKLKADATGKTVHQLEDKGIFPESFLNEDDEISALFVSNLAWLFHYRISTFANKFNQRVFDRIVMGQRMGLMLEHNTELFESIQGRIITSISDSADLSRELKDHYLNSDFLKTSTLIHAPIIGAAVSTDKHDE